MEREEIVILDDGSDEPVGSEGICCSMIYTPFRVQDIEFNPEYFIRGACSPFLLNWCNIFATQPGPRLKHPSGKTSRYSITANGVIRTLAIWHRPFSPMCTTFNQRSLEMRVSTVDSTPQAKGTHVRWFHDSVDAFQRGTICRGILIGVSKSLG